MRTERGRKKKRGLPTPDLQKTDRAPTPGRAVRGKKRGRKKEKRRRKEKTGSRWRYAATTEDLNSLLRATFRDKERKRRKGRKGEKDASATRINLLRRSALSYLVDDRGKRKERGKRRGEDWVAGQPYLSQTKGSIA